MDSMQNTSFDFCKVFCLQTCSQKMEIPISYTESEKRLPSKVILMGRCTTKAWSIEITETGDGMFFHKGWAEFVEDNSFTNGDVLVFDYNGLGVFQFSIIDSSYCEKVMVNGSQGQLKGLKENDGDDNSQDAVFLGEADINYIVYNKVIKDEEMEAAEEDNDDGHHTRSKKKRCIAGGYEGAASAKERDASAKERDARAQERDARAKKRDANAKKRDASSKEGDANAKKREASAKKKDASAKKGDASAKENDASVEVRDVPDHFGIDLFKSGRYAQPTNPYFVTRIRPKRRGDLYIPTEVTKAHKIVLPPTVTLRDTKGKEWTSNVKVWGDGRIWLTGGWKSLCRWNLIEKEERIICEFVPSVGQDWVLQVTVVRE